MSSVNLQAHDILESHFSAALSRLRVAAYSISAAQDSAKSISPSIELICGYPAASLISTPSIWLNWIHPEDRAYVEEYFAAVAPDSDYDLCYRIQHRNGSAVFIRDAGHFHGPTETEAGCYEGLIWKLASSGTGLLDSVESFQLYDSLSQAIPDLWLVLDHRSRILYCKPGTEVQPVRPAQEIIGLAIHEVLPPELAKVVEEYCVTTELRKYEYCLDTGTNGKRCFEAQFSPIGNQRCLVIVSDVTDRIEITATLEKRNAILAAMSAFAQLFLGKPLKLDFHDFVSAIGSAADVDRCFVFQNRVDSNSGQVLYRQISEWCRSGISSQMDNEQLYDLSYEEVGFGDVAREMAAGQVLTLTPEDLPEPARSILAEQEILTLVLAPIFVEGKWWGFFGFDECIVRREWHQAEKDTLAGASALLGLALQQQKYQSNLLEREQKFRTVFENAPSPILLTATDSDEIVEANLAAIDSFQLPQLTAPVPNRLSSLLRSADNSPSADGKSHVQWANTSGQPHPYLVTSAELSLQEGSRKAWFFHSLQEAYERERETRVHTQLLSSLANANSQIAANPASHECASILAHALLDTAYVASVAAVPIDELHRSESFYLGAGSSQVNSGESAIHCFQNAVSALMTKPKYGGVFSQGLALALATKQCRELNLPVVSPDNVVFVYPVVRHNMLFAALFVEWDSAVGPISNRSPLLNFADAFGRCAEAKRVLDFNQRVKKLSTDVASADSLAALIRLACDAIVADEESAFVVAFLRIAPDDIAHRTYITPLPDDFKAAEIPSQVIFSDVAEPARWQTSIDSEAVGANPGVRGLIPHRIAFDDIYTADLYVQSRDRVLSSSWINYILHSITEIVLSGYRALRARRLSQLAERKLERMLQFAEVFHVLLTDEGRLLQINSYASQQFLSIGINIVPGDSLYDILQEADQELLRFGFRNVASSPKVSLCLEFSKPGGEPLTIEGYLSSTEDSSNVYEWVGLDVTEKRSTRTNLRLLQEYFQRTQSPAVITRWENLQPRIVEANEAFQCEIGASRPYPDVRDASLAELVGQQASLILDLAKSQESVSHQIYIESAKRWFEVVVTPIMVEWSSKIHHVWIFGDVTREKQIATNLAKALLHEKQTHELKSRLIATSSHEFRTPLAVISSSVDLLERYSMSTADERNTALLKKIRNSVKRMAEMIERVLEVEKTSPTAELKKLTPVHIQRVAAEVVSELAAAYPTAARVQFEAPRDPVFVLDDGQSLNLILANLLLNARKYSTLKGKVGMRIEVNSSVVTFAISDNGIGIPQQDLLTIFDPFTRGSNTSQIAGTGVGLSIVKHCVNKLQGKIDVQSVEGMGTTVTVQLPQVVSSEISLAASSPLSPDSHPEGSFASDSIWSFDG